MFESSEPTNPRVTSFLSAAQQGNLTTLKAVLASDPGVLNAADHFGETALIEATKHNKIEAVEFLLAAGADATIAAGNGYAPIHEASRFGHLKVVQALVENLIARDPGLINLRSAQEWTALHFAAEGKHAAIANFLMENGADVNLVTSKRESALTISLDKKASAIVTAILDKSETDVTLANERGVTALHRAVRNGDASVVEKIILKGADVNAVATGAEGRKFKPIDLASTEEIRDLINSQISSPLAVTTVFSAASVVAQQQASVGK